MKILRKLYDKSRIWFAIAFIIAYCVLMSVGDAISALVGLDKSVTLAVALAFSVIILSFLKENGLFREYGLCMPKASARSMLYYLPILAMLTANLWFGVTVNGSALEGVLYILTMLCVGFLEEIIFRGLLFEVMRKDSPRAAIIVSSVTFGIGHIINLINGSGAELLPNLLQVVYATSAGFMFVMMYYRSKSLLVCIIAHGVFNALNFFAAEVTDDGLRILSALLLTLITGFYGIYLSLLVKKTSD